MRHHTVAIQQVQHIVQGALHQGLALAPLLQRAGIPPALLQAPLARVSQQQYALLIRVLRRSTRDELWGLCRNPLPVGSFAQCAALGLQCRTLDTALRAALRHLHGLAGLREAFVPRLLLQGDVARVQLVRRPQPAGLSGTDQQATARLDYAQKAFLLFAFGLACWWVARRVPLLGVDYTAPTPRSDSSRVYQAPIVFGQPHIGLQFEARWLALPVVQSPQSLREFLAGAPANLLIKYRDTSRVSERIRRLLLRQLDTNLPSLHQVGQALGINAQTLRRRLREEGHGYQALKDGLRRDTAIALLGQPGLGLLEIANRVGFSEASTFARAFKHWTGVAPGAYRLAHSGAGDLLLPASAHLQPG